VRRQPATGAWSRQACQNAAVERAVDRFEDWTTTSELLDLLRRHTRAR
jgi:hypothetical protein